jgi:DNA replication protein DnaC
MKSDNQDILEMLDVLKLPVAVKTFRALQKSPELGHYSAMQLIRELLTPQYLETLNKRFETNLQYSGVINKGALIENLKTGNGRIYNDTTVEQVLSFSFAEDRLNVGVYGVTGAGKSYFLSACCVEACQKNFRGRFIDYCDLLDELIMLKRQGDMKKYRKKLRYYAKLQLLFIDDFAISRYPEEGMNILYQLVKMRADLGTSTLYTSQYAPDEWGMHLSDEPKCYGKLDGIRRRLTTGFTVLIEKATDDQ